MWSVNASLVPTWEQITSGFPLRAIACHFGYELPLINWTSGSFFWPAPCGNNMLPSSPPPLPMEPQRWFRVWHHGDLIGPYCYGRTPPGYGGEPNSNGVGRLIDGVTDIVSSKTRLEVASAIFHTFLLRSQAVLPGLPLATFITLLLFLLLILLIGGVTTTLAISNAVQHRRLQRQGTAVARRLERCTAMERDLKLLEDHLAAQKQEQEETVKQLVSQLTSGLTAENSNLTKLLNDAKELESCLAADKCDAEQKLVVAAELQATTEKTLKETTQELVESEKDVRSLRNSRDLAGRRNQLLRSECSSLEDKLQTQEGQLNDERQKATNAEQQLLIVEREKQDLSKELGKANVTAHDNYINACHVKKNELKMRKRLSKVEKAKRKLQQDIEVEESARESLKEREEELAILRRGAEELISDLRGQIQSATEKQNILEQEVKQAKHAEGQTSEALDSAKARIQDMAVMEQRLATKTTELAAMAETVKTTADELSAAKTTVVEQRKSAMMASHEAGEKFRDQVRRTNLVAEQKKEVQKLLEEAAKSSVEKEQAAVAVQTQLQNDIAALHQQIAQNAAAGNPQPDLEVMLNAQLSASQSETETLKSQIHHMERELTLERQKVASMSQLHTDLVNAQQIARELSEEKKASEAKLTALQLSLDEARNAQGAMESEFQSVKDDHQREINAKAAQEFLLSATQGTLAQTTTARDEAQKEVQQLKSELQAERLLRLEAETSLNIARWTREQEEDRTKSHAERQDLDMVEAGQIPGNAGNAGNGDDEIELDFTDPIWNKENLDKALVNFEVDDDEAANTLLDEAFQTALQQSGAILTAQRQGGAEARDDSSGDDGEDPMGDLIKAAALSTTGPTANVDPSLTSPLQPSAQREEVVVDSQPLNEGGDASAARAPTAGDESSAVMDHAQLQASNIGSESQDPVTEDTISHVFHFPNATPLSVAPAIPSTSNAGHGEVQPNFEFPNPVPAVERTATVRATAPGRADKNRRWRAEKRRREAAAKRARLNEVMNNIFALDPQK